VTLIAILLMLLSKAGKSGFYQKKKKEKVKQWMALRIRSVV